MKRRLIPIALAGAVCMGGSSAHAQLAVYDAASYAKLIQQATTAVNQLNEMKTQVSQGQQLLSSLNDASGVSKIASALGVPSLRSFLPDTSAFSAAAKGDFSALGAIGAKADAIRSANRLWTAPADDPLGADLEAAGQRAARDLALGQSVTDAGAQRLEGLKDLQAAIDTAPNARAVMDLQARATTEQAMIANDQMRLQGIAMAQAAEDRLRVQRDQERAKAESASRMAIYRSSFQ
ncbi:MAG: type IV secretion system protein [Phenylobacterium sp.]|uniref:type IV secretion system protein n=1 Tax=Phenylobacterium sp. TaxID=1871053 RepID=UPI001A593C27|nr:type IV secretion system protein [Phenylobacterium sp.]MBL8552860.1 type IV secretion system protein [Phenylobacterium sp.]